MPQAIQIEKTGQEHCACNALSPGFPDSDVCYVIHVLTTDHFILEKHGVIMTKPPTPKKAQRVLPEIFF